MKIICDSCGTKYSIADEKVRGKVFKIKCKKCSHIIVVRGASADDAPAAGQPDEKETKVFDYSGYDSPSEAAAALAAGAGDDEAVWHLVIDQEQVGPMTVAEVQERYQRGEIDSETYTWREGFGDWQRLAAVEAFAGLAGSGAGAAVQAPVAGEFGGGDAAYGGDAADDAIGGMFGGPGLDDGGAAQNDPGDLFSAASGDAPAGADGGGMDLFSGGGGGAEAGFGGGLAASGGDGGGLFGAGGGLDEGGEAHDAAMGGSSLTGERNENSVLFSLSNLASLASDAPKAAAAPTPVAAPSGGGGQPGMAQAGGTEGSGLIDIRSMAQVYLGDKQDAGGPGLAAPAAPDDLPVFSQGAFEGGGQVLLPTAQGDSNNKLLYALLGVIGLLVVAATVLILMVLTGDDDKQAAASGNGTQVASNTTGQGGATPPTGDPTGGATGAAGGAGATDGTGDTAGTDTAAGGDDTDGAGDDGDDKGGDDGDDKGSSKGSSKSSSKGSSRGSSRGSSKSSSKGSSSSSDSGSSSSSSSGRKEKCDEVACLVDPSLPCCGKSKSRGSSSGGGSKGSSDSNLPERPSRTDISSGIAKVRGRVQSCGDKHSFKGTVTVKLAIEGSGKVSSASANKGDSAFKSCVTSAAKKAKFKKSQKGLTVNYPFVFR